MVRAPDDVDADDAGEDEQLQDDSAAHAAAASSSSSVKKASAAHAAAASSSSSIKKASASHAAAASSSSSSSSSSSLKVDWDAFHQLAVPKAVKLKTVDEVCAENGWSIEDVTGEQAGVGVRVALQARRTRHGGGKQHRATPRHSKPR